MNQTIARPIAQTLEINRVLRNTYALLAMTLLFSALTALLSMVNQWPHPGLALTLIGYFGLLFVTTRLRNSAWGILAVFALTGFMGLTLGPVINAYLARFVNGDELVILALGGTGVIFLGLSAFALTTRRDFSFLGQFLLVGILVAFVAGIASVLFGLSALALAVSSMFMLLMGGLIVYETQQIARGGETNYIMATVTLYVTIYNLFSSLLHLLGFGLGED